MIAHAWLSEAACRDVDSEVFFGNDKRTDWRVPLSICRICVVRQPCLADALRTEVTPGSVHGMRGALTPKERARLVRAR